MKKMKDHMLLIFTAVHAAIFLIIFLPISQAFFIEPAQLERYFALEMLQGHVPYRDLAAEYPPLALLIFLLPGLLFRSPLAYSIAFAVEMLLLDIAVLWILDSLAARFRLPRMQVLSIYTLFVLGAGPLLIVRYDLLPAALVLAALWAFTSGKNRASWAFLGLGFMAKLYPVIVAPLFALYQLRRKQYRAMFYGIAVFAGVLLALGLPFLIISESGFINSFLYHDQRGLHWESTYATFLLVMQLFGLITVRGDITFGSWNIISPPVADTLAQIATPLTVFLLLGLYALYFRRAWRRPDANSTTLDEQPQGREIITFATAAVVIFMAAGKVLSVQYLIWLVPLIPLYYGRWNVAVWPMFFVALGITQYIYPYGYSGLQYGQAVPVALMFTRNVILLVIAALLLLPQKGKITGSKGV